MGCVKYESNTKVWKMKNFVALLIVWVAFATAPAFADFQKGYDAFNKGDYATALAEWQPLAEQGDVKAQSYLGFMYSRGRGVLQDYQEALKWTKLSAEGGDAKAQGFLGAIYALGEGVPQDYVRAHMWSNIATANGETATVTRDIVAKKMTSAEIKKAQKLARECVAKKYKGC